MNKATMDLPDCIAFHDDWGDWDRLLLPDDVIAAALAGETLRPPTPEERKVLKAARLREKKENTKRRLGVQKQMRRVAPGLAVGKRSGVACVSGGRLVPLNRHELGVLLDATAALYEEVTGQREGGK